MTTVSFLAIGRRARAWLLLGLLLLSTAPVAHAQTPTLPRRAPGLDPAPLQTRQLAADRPAVDTARVFSLQDLADLVFANHPMVKQAALLSADAQAQVLAARGGFDPKLGSGFDRKLFGGTDYYNKWANELKVPILPGGIDLKAGYDRMVGTYVNPEYRTPLDGLAGVGLSVPLGAGLLIDARRSTLRQARIMVTAAEADQVKQINEVWLQAVKDYWNWYYATQQANLVREGVALADTRFQATSRRALLGDQAPIDSVEARITVQDRQLQAEQLSVELLNARLLLSNHLWNKDAQPVELPAYAVPQRPTLVRVDTAQFGQLQSQAAVSHPTLIKLDAKIRQLGVEERYRREMLKPKLSVSGMLLSRGDFYRPEMPAYYDFGRNNYKLGVDFAFPLFLRQERGKLQQTRLKVQDATLEQQQSRRTIVNQVQAVYNTLLAYERQLALQEQTIANQRTLLQAELQKFELGESTIFLINARESKLIELRIKQESLRASYEKTRAELYYYAGTRTLGAQ
ncbi:TolC family protein [Hymenobacter cellulosivorans]|uniref:TolC family protein n=1 Tax=Hymenobacter cellulosivorans TaxID=2932249 RepID=A0ABY4F3X2_9BACT|nr:TolC family protein [Hymenobacter cellulosivorans]UOQ51339.1 TolC family protein [Hymenobacter cellulosivorans]